MRISLAKHREDLPGPGSRNAVRSWLAPRPSGPGESQLAPMPRRRPGQLAWRPGRHSKEAIFQKLRPWPEFLLYVPALGIDCSGLVPGTSVTSASEPHQAQSWIWDAQGTGLCLGD